MSTYHFLCCKQCKTKAFVLTQMIAGRAATGNTKEITEFLYLHCRENPRLRHEFVLLSEHDREVNEYSDFMVDDEED